MKFNKNKNEGAELFDLRKPNKLNDYDEELGVAFDIDIEEDPFMDE